MKNLNVGVGRGQREKTTERERLLEEEGSEERKKVLFFGTIIN